MNKIFQKIKEHESLFQALFCVLVLAVVILSGAASFVSCSAKKAGYRSEADFGAVSTSAINMKQAAPAAVMSKAAGFAVEEAADFAVDDYMAESGSKAQGEAVQGARKLIYTGNISVQVTDLTETEKNVAGWVEKFGGYITSSSISGRYLNVVARIPQSRFNQAFEEGSSLGTLNNRSVSTQDVTEQFFDLSARLETRKILRERLESYLKNAPKIEDMLSIERELNDVQGEIESMEGQFRRLSNQIDFATIYFDASLPPNTTEQGFTYPNVGKKFSQFWADALEFLASFLVGIFYFVVYAVPFVLAAALLYFICFGRLGLVRKLFALAGKKSAKTKENTDKPKN
ncbi:MAG: DUF4349 domain-containing protein [Spirochaetaceae bacterium]|nr:DUF4349 domain-containing protein [Spirochaetaceae bacterium]